MPDKNYTGVRWNSLMQSYCAKITHKGIPYNCGCHVTAREAAIARDKKILEKNIPAKLQVLKPKV